MKNYGAKVPGKADKPGRPKGETGWGGQRVPQVRVERAVFQQVKRFAVTSASARIFLQHLCLRKR
jgi:hypothetical protein